MARMMIRVGAAMGLLAVLAGAFGVHGLTGRLTERDLAIWHTAAQYQMYHALALLATAWISERSESRFATAAGWFFIAGMVCFSGSLYVLAVSEIGFGRRMGWLGMVAPVGGVSFMAGWACLFCSAWKKAEKAA